MGLGHQRLLLGDRRGGGAHRATAFGLSSVLFVGAGAYLIALPAFFAVLLPVREAAPGWRGAPAPAAGSVG